MGVFLLLSMIYSPDQEIHYQVLNRLWKCCLLQLVIVRSVVVNDYEVHYCVAP